MPQLFRDAVLTEDAANIILHSQNGEMSSHFTRFAVGDGTYTEEEKAEDSLKKMTALKHEKNSYPISSIEYLPNEQHAVVLTTIISNCSRSDKTVALVDEGYYITEVGLYCEVKETGEEYLYSVIVVDGDTGDFMPPYTGHNPVEIVQDLTVTVGNSATVTIESPGTYPLAEDLTAMQVKLESAVNHMRLHRQMHLENVFQEPVTADDEGHFYLADDDGGALMYEWQYVIKGEGTSAGTDNYEELVNKPQINGVELVGNKTPEELGFADQDRVLMASEEDLDQTVDEGETPTISKVTVKKTTAKRSRKKATS